MAHHPDAHGALYVKSDHRVLFKAKNRFNQGHQRTGMHMLLYHQHLLPQPGNVIRPLFFLYFSIKLFHNTPQN
jgi:hypothetical protein